jgi:hypothetical protein
MMEKAVIDRFEGEYAVLLVGEEQRKMDVPRSKLPKGAREGSWVQVEIVAGKVSKINLDPQETERAKARIADKRARLKKGEHRGR